MDILHQPVEIPVTASQSAFVLEGMLSDYSTKSLHTHSCHQILKIRTGITLLVEENRKQPLFSIMTAFIPAGLAHRSVILGETVYYKSIYLEPSIFNKDIGDIVIFDMSPLGVALFDRITHLEQSLENDLKTLDRQCLDLFLKLMETEIHHRSCLTRIPVPRNPENLKITQYIDHNFQNRLKLSDFTNVLHYSERHVSRMFKNDLKITLFEYLKLYRIFQSSLMLCNKGFSKTITEIAFSCGYESLSSFYKDFKDIFSLTPKAFRKKTLGNKLWKTGYGTGIENDAL